MMNSGNRYKTRIFSLFVGLSVLLFSLTVSAAYQQWSGVAVQRTTAYTNSALTTRNGVEYVDAGDNITVLDETDRAYFVRYPTSRGTKDRWVSKSVFGNLQQNSLANAASQAVNNVVNNSYQEWQGTCKRRTTAFTNAALNARNGVEYVDAGDAVTVLKEEGNAYFVRYPVRNGTKERWVAKNYITRNNNAGTSAMGNAASQAVNNVVNNSYQEWQGTCKRRTTAFTNAALNARNGVEYVDAGDAVTVLKEEGNSYFVRYPVRNGTKERWVVKSAISRDSSNTNISMPIANSTEGNAVVEHLWYMKQNVAGFKQGTRYTGSGQCRGFANKVYLYIFPGVSYIGGYTNDNFGAQSYNGSYRAGALANFAADDINAVKQLFNSVKPGSFIQMGRRYKLNSTKTAPAPHSAILAGVYADGCDFYEANYDGHNTIALNHYTWANLADRNKGFTIYTPNDYRLK